MLLAKISRENRADITPLAFTAAPPNPQVRQDPPLRHRSRCIRRGVDGTSHLPGAVSAGERRGLGRAANEGEKRKRETSECNQTLIAPLAKENTFWERNVLKYRCSSDSCQRVRAVCAALETYLSLKIGRHSREEKETEG